MCDQREHLVGMSVAFILGTALGAGLALLFAPASGVETRRRLREAGAKAVEEGRGKAHDLMAKAKERMHHARVEAPEA
jgi:gas vesicle protein